MKVLNTQRAAAAMFAAAIALAGCDSASNRPAEANKAEDHSHDGHDHSHDGHDHADHGHAHAGHGTFVPREPEDGTVDVFVSNYPLKTFAEAIGGDSVKVHFLAPAGEDPAFWQPDAADVKKLQTFDILLFNGATYEKWFDTVTLAESRIVDTSADFEDEYITLHDAVTHSHGPGEEHSHAGTAFTTWLDPLLAIRQAEAVAETFAMQQPARKAEYDARLAELKSSLEAVDARVKAIVAGKNDRPLVASHPVYDYLARRYALNVRSLHWEPGVEPSAEEWIKFGEILAEHPAKFMLWEGEPAEGTKSRLADEEVVPVVFEPLMNVPESGDFFSRMNENVDRLEAAFK